MLEELRKKTGTLKASMSSSRESDLKVGNYQGQRIALEITEPRGRNTLTRSGRVKRYAELIGNYEKSLIKSSDGNNTQQYSSLHSELSCCECNYGRWTLRSQAHHQGDLMMHNPEYRSTPSRGQDRSGKTLVSARTTDKGNSLELDIQSRHTIYMKGVRRTANRPGNPRKLASRDRSGRKLNGLCVTKIGEKNWNPKTNIVKGIRGEGQAQKLGQPQRIASEIMMPRGSDNPFVGLKRYADQPGNWLKSEIKSLDDNTVHSSRDLDCVVSERFQDRSRNVSRVTA